MENVQCQMRPLQHNSTFSIVKQLVSDLKPSVQGLVGDMEDANYNLTEIVWVWMAGIICAFLVVALYPWSFRRAKMLGGRYWCLLPCFLALVGIIVLD